MKAACAPRNPVLLADEIFHEKFCVLCPSEERDLEGDFIINVDGYGRPGMPRTSTSSVEPHRLTYSFCGSGTAKICEHVRPEHRRSPQWMHCREPHQFSHPLVCKQFWSETSRVIYQNSTWVFHNPHDLILFINSRQAVVSRVQKVVINAQDNESLVAFCNKWQQALTWRNMRYFRCLRGFGLRIEVNYDRNEMRNRTDLMKDQMWVKARLPLIIRAIQQHKLEPDLTTVDIPCGIEPAFRAWASEFRRLVLEHVPLGQSSIRRERRWMKEAENRSRRHL
jgi:hypothetical protein